MKETLSSAAAQLRLLDGASEKPAPLKGWADKMRAQLDLREQIRGFKRREMEHEKTREELLWEVSILGEALEAILETRPIHLRRNDTKKHCTTWPNCNHACGEGLHRTHGLAESALKEAFGEKWAQRVKTRLAELAAEAESDNDDGEE